MSKYNVSIGSKFNRLTIIAYQYFSQSGQQQYWLCKCDCGNYKSCSRANIISGQVKSCGCLKKEGHNNRKHSHTQVGHISKEYHAWISAKQRCYNKKTHNYYRYGGRGITMFEGWINDFNAFYQYLGPCPSKSHSIDRINNNLGYEPGNVRWATSTQQANNRRPRRKLVHIKNEV